ncbi:PspC domain-containing protein [Loigolactobacillus bifermentans]|jgi:phage shock protein PspC (stress-responsive transcriptional regulator)|uniref:Phage shock protein PspC N-terminal domain-containing protein n=1 Tax=Loigolactobacillus bifermentans DSM 20003 TaxID=1423726 RepID=A0A0R1GF11_9LACO|nr:PspC domain-containing protein [Loigolactobacillus bifermentans]KRK32635.1 hypothetical protein FC07_GL002066 [Loigolactobacillus bifermentans DSM 20003]QGG60301.1 PspC domain-containing protein [Loigolactobacillus bifermentans]
MKHLTKSTDRVLSGVVGGFADYLGIDHTLARVLYAGATLFFFPLVVLYIIAALVMPNA